MQRTVAEGVIIACDFCGTDWDQALHMIEGHHGSVLCLNCLKKALEELEAKPGKYRCTLCLSEGIDQSKSRWSGSFSRADFEGSVGVVCESCVRQAARGFSKDEDIDWTWKS